MDKKSLQIATVLGFVLLASTTILPVSSYTERELPTINVAHMPYPGLNAGYLVWDAGLYRDSGFKIGKFNEFIIGGPMVEAMLAGECDVGVMGTPPLLSMYASHPNVRIIYVYKETYHEHWIMVRPDSPILKVKGWNPNYPDVYGSPDTIRGATVLSTIHTNGDYVFAQYLKIFGLTRDDVNIVSMSQADILSAMDTQGDIFVLWMPFNLLAEAKGYVKVADEADIKAPVYLLGCTTTDFAERNPELVARWVEAIARAQSKLKADPLFMYSVDYKAQSMAGIQLDLNLYLPTYVPESIWRPCDLERNLELFTEPAPGEDSEVERNIRAMMDLFVSYGYLEEELDLDTLLDDTYLRMVEQKKNEVPDLINNAKKAIDDAEKAGVSEEVLSPLKRLISRAEYLYNDGAYYGAGDIAEEVIAQINAITQGVELTPVTTEVIPMWLVATNVAIPIVVGVVVYLVMRRKRRGSQ